MEERHRFGDAVEGQRSCTVIHVDSDSGSGKAPKFRSDAVVPERYAIRGTLEAPGLCVPSKLAVRRLSFPADAFIRDG